MNTRDAVLARITAALSDVPAQEQPGRSPVPRDYHHDRCDRSDDLVTLFTTHLVEYRATVTHTTQDSAQDTVVGVLRKRATRSLVVPDGFPRSLLPPDGPRLLHDTAPLPTATIEAADAVITTAAVGIASTGTIVLDTGRGQGRRVLSLLPDHHVCVMWTDQIVYDVPEALSRLAAGDPLTFISGPSATSDIELDRVEGVHGPRMLDVVLVSPHPTESESA
ncbi:lactate utilization protein C [Streptomyces californicus]|uniref:lactate utilization protein C n=1 Tax=Streptomyces californicus TaxID=67351 RepID=UPI0037B6C991